MRGALAVVLACVVGLGACAPAAPASKPVEAPTSAPVAAPAAPAKPADASAAKPATSPAAAASPVASPAAPAASPAAASGPLTTLRLAATASMNYVSVYVGVEKGTFLKYGLDVKPNLLASGPEAVKAVQAGDAEIGGANFATLISARAGGTNLKGFALLMSDPTVLNNDDTLAILVPPGSPIQKVADLAGKKVGLTVGGAVDPYMRLQLQDAGVDPSKVELFNGTFANMPSILKSGSVDAALFQEPYGEQYLNDVPGGRVLVRGGGKVAFRIQAAATDEWLAKNRPLAEKFATALAEASQYVRQNPEESATISTRWLPGLSAVVARKAMTHLDFDPRLSPFMATSWEGDAKTLLDQKRTTRLVSFNEGFDSTIQDGVLQQQPQFFSDLKPIPR
ncbi:MAG: ABC transporter substrate-binding protein [Chloroflexi bacterium]|nr:ABC transporter substrate-binding protein [Chloroflexota bacterium]